MEKESLTLGELEGELYALKKEYMSGDLPVMVDTPNGVFDAGHLCSYRGYYEDLSLDLTEPVTLNDLMSEAESLSRGGMVEGYKGIEYWMDGSTAVWAAPYGEVWGLIVCGVHVKKGKIIIETKEIG